MKQIIATVIVAFASLASASSASAQKIAGRVEVPFSFTVGDTQMPPGVYFLKADGIYTSISRKGIFWGSYMNPNVPSNTGSSDKVEIVFAVYGDQHFLREIEYGPGNVIYKLPLSKAERRVQQHTPAVLGD